MSHVIADLPMDRYVRDDVGCESPTLNSSTAVRLLEQSPMHAWYGHPKLNPEWAPRHAEMFDLGTAVHAILFEDEPNLEIIKADDWRSKGAKEIRDLARAEGKTPLLAHQAETVEKVATAAAKAIARCDELSGIWDGARKEQTYVWQHEGVWLRCRPDLVSADHRIILSYKTTMQVAEPDSYVRTLTNLSYEVQAAFELAAVEAVTGVRAKYVWVVSEMEAPYVASVLGLSNEMEDYGVSRMNAAVNRWRDCLKRDWWGGYPNRVAWVETPPYLRAAWEEREHRFRPMREQPDFLSVVGGDQ